MRCDQCGANNAVGAKFCGGCGRPLDAPTPDSPSPESPAAYVPGEDPPSKRKTRLVVAGVVVVLVLLIVGALVVVKPFGGDEGGDELVALGSSGLAGRAGEQSVVVPAALRTEPKEEWSVTTSGDIGNVTTAGSSVFLVTADSDDEQLDLTAFEVSSGEERWTTTIDDVATYSVVSLIDGVVLLASTSRSSASRDAKVWAFDETTGQALWDQTLKGSNARVEPVSGGIALLGSFDHESGPANAALAEVAMVEPKTGDRIWAQEFTGVGVALDASAVYTLDDETIEARSTATGEVVWSVVESDISDIGTAAGLVLVQRSSSGDDDSTTVAFESESGEIVWEVDTPTRDGSAYSFASLGQSRVVIQGYESQVVVDASDGSTLWDVNDASIVSGLQIDGDDGAMVVEAEDDSSTVSLHNADTGKALRSIEVDDPVSAIESGQDIIYTAYEGWVTGYDFSSGPTSGERLWEWHDPDADAASNVALEVIAIDGGLLVLTPDRLWRLG